ncbi:haloacid dehalogenase type II [Kiloniella laminariae]|uniref:(S)-2-haloacid dehalogenase n=1 Tax=Kiloniella laminariae TaxID=454162 RepID=A0ABT4LGG5_9PROT|nr:haloacid dehalogenase type II [Kiloniella laminariae]MCZ4280192.1 haloacid dehalogenase type II [Kiloniella laminariae]
MKQLDPQVQKPAIKAFVFDAYGTLLDVHSTVSRSLDDLGDAAPAVSETWRTKQLEYSWLRSLMGKHADFWQVTADALTYALRCHDMEDQARHDRLMNLYRELLAYSDALETLEFLKEKQHTTLVLSNGSQGMLGEALTFAGLDKYLDAALSIDKIGIYKPSPNVYRLVLDYMSRQHKTCRAEEILFVSANAWDVAGANSFGFRVAWINRFNHPAEVLPGGPDLTIKSLSELIPLG